MKSQVDVMTMCNERVNQVETEGGKLIVTDDDEGEPDESTNREQPRKRRRETNPTRGASDKTTETEASPNEPARESQPCNQMRLIANGAHRRDMLLPKGLISKHTSEY